MKKKYFISRLAIFGFLTLGTATAFVGCKDYDDDISSLQSQIDANKTDLSKSLTDKIAALQTQLDALKTVETTLQTSLTTAQANITTAKATADQAKIDAANAAAAAAQAKLDAIASAKAEISTLKTQLEAKDAELKTLIDKAQGDATKNAAAIAQLIIANETANTSINKIIGRLSAVEAVIPDLQEAAATLKTSIGVLQSAVGTLRSDLTTTQETLDRYMRATDLQIDALKLYSEATKKSTDSIGNELLKVKGELALQDKKLDARIDSLRGAVLSKESFTSFTTAYDQYKAGQATIIAQMQSDITGLKEFNDKYKSILENFDQIIATKIDEKMAVLKADILLNMITGLTIQGDDINWKIGAKIPAVVKFGPNDEVVIPANTYLSKIEGGVFVTVNPSSADATQYNFVLENSKGEAAPLKFGKASVAAMSSPLTKAVSSNGLWKLPVIQNYTSSVSNFDSNINSNGKQIVFAVGLLNDSVPARKIYSKYELALSAPTAPTVPVSVTPASPVLKVLTNGTVNISGDVYRSYITTNLGQATETQYGLTGLNSLFEGNLVTLSATSSNAANKTISYEWHYIDYNGSIGVIPFSITYTQPLFADASSEITPTPGGAGYQTAGGQLNTMFSTIGANRELWNNNLGNFVQYDVLDSEGHPSVDSKFKIEFLNASNVVTTVPADIKSMKITYDPSAFTPGVLYTGKLIFKHATTLLPVNVVNLTFKMNMPTWPSAVSRIGAAFTDNATVAWGVLDKSDPNNLKAVYNLAGSFNGMSLFNGMNDANVIFTDKRVSNTAPQIGFNNHIASISLANVENTIFPAEIGYKHFGLTNLYDFMPVNNGRFSIQFRSAIEQAKITSVRNNSILYGQVNGVANTRTMLSADLTSQDPSVASEMLINYFNTRDSRIITIVPEVVDPNNAGNQGLISAAFNGSGQLVVTSTYNTGITSNVNLIINLKITDELGRSSVKAIPFTVIKPQ